MAMPLADAFPTFTAAELGIVESFGSRTAVSIGDVLFHAGDTSSSFFAIVSGAVEIIKNLDTRGRTLIPITRRGSSEAGDAS